MVMKLAPKFVPEYEILIVFIGKVVVYFSGQPTNNDTKDEYTNNYHYKSKCGHDISVF